jgi:hypothetical protein
MRPARIRGNCAIRRGEPADLARPRGTARRLPWLSSAPAARCATTPADTLRDEARPATDGAVRATKRPVEMESLATALEVDTLSELGYT